MCDKQPYSTKAEAREAAKGISKRGRGSMQHYFCKECGCWHIRTMGKGKKLSKTKRNNNKYPFRYQPVKMGEKKKKR